MAKRKGKRSGKKPTTKSWLTPQPNSSKASTSTIVYGIYSSASPEVIYRQNIKHVKEYLSTPKMLKHGTGRFRKFQSREEAMLFFKENPVKKLLALPEIHESQDVDDENDENDDSPPAEENTIRALMRMPTYFNQQKFLQCIKKGQNDEGIQRLHQNPCYFLHMSIGQPLILKHGSRFNILHLCAQYNNLIIAKEVMKLVGDVGYITKIYATSRHAKETSKNLIDRFLNTPELISGKTPLLLAAENGHDEMVLFLSSFPEAQLATDDEVKDIEKDFKEHHSLNHEKIIHYLQNPSKTFCVTLFKETHDQEMPFIAITSRFPHTSIDGNQKCDYFNSISASKFTSREEDGTMKIRVSKDFIQNNDSPKCHGMLSYIPYAWIGIFGEKWKAAQCYQMWQEEFNQRSHKNPPHFCQHLTNFAKKFADANNYSLTFLAPEMKISEDESKIKIDENENEILSEVVESLISKIENLQIV